MVRRDTDGREVDVILDMVGGDYVPRNLEALAEDGRLAQIATELSASVWLLIDAGRIRPVIHMRIPLREAWRAHQLMEVGNHIGKIVLEVAN